VTVSAMAMIASLLIVNERSVVFARHNLGWSWTYERVQLRQLLHKYRDIFSKDEFDIGQFQGVEYTMDTGEAQPIKQRKKNNWWRCVTVSAMAMIASLLIVNERSVVFARHNLGWSWTL
jgi:hypothetical protein